MFAELCAHIKSSSANRDAAGLLQYATSAGSSTDIGSALEIGFRNEARSFDMHQEHDFQALVQLLRFSIEFANVGHELSVNVGKIPFLLISDVLERETIAVAERVWSSVEELADDLTAAVLFSKGKMTVLKFCNALLRRLSKSCNTEFCGRILMFLAAVYPLSERSAVNISGKSNTSNLTGFEDTADFDALMDGPVSDGIAAAGMYGDACSDGDDVDELLRIARGRFSGSAADHIAADSKEDATAAVDYNLYKIFWGIQNFVAGDPIKSAAVTPAVISEFITNADTVMSAFEANAFTDSGLEQSLHSWDQLQKLAILHANRRIQQGPIVNEKQAGTTPTLAHDDSYAGCKYLTSSQLFALQLKDPVIREQLSTQLLMHLHYLRDRLPSGAEELTSVSKMEKRIHAILKKTPPNGSHFLKSLTSLLDREQHWSAWKKKGCLPFERLRQEEQEKLSSRKRKRDSGDACVDRADISAKSFTIQIDSSALQSTLQSISSRIPTFEAHMERYIDAEDPDAGIEEEYHPKNDKIYCWRARRLLANKKLAAFEDMADGDVGKGLKKMQKIINPQQTAVGGTTEAEIKKEDSSAAPVLDGNVITTKIDEE